MTTRKDEKSLVKGKAEKSLYKIDAINREINDMKRILDDVKKDLVNPASTVVGIY